MALSEDQLRAAALLAEGRSQIKVAEICGIHTGTINKWARHHEEFIAERKRVEQDILLDIELTFRSKNQMAIKRLEELMQTKNERIALGAVKAHFEIWMKMKELTDFEERLRLVEELNGIRK